MADGVPSTRANGEAQSAAWAGTRSRFVARVRARWPQIAIYLLVIFALDIVRNYALHPFSFDQFLVEGVAPVLGIAVAIGGGSIAGALVAEALPLHGIARVAAIVVLALVGASLGNGIVGLLDPGYLVPQSQRVEGLTSSAFLLRNLWYYSATAVLLAAYFATRDRDAAIARMAQAEELKRGNVQRAVMESRLRVIQARVEPSLLFDVLADVQRLYASAPADAEALLDDLIVYLRAALPQMRGDASTLAQEAALAAAYIKVTPAARQGTIEYTENIPDALRDLPFPPMVLLPLMHAAADARAPSLSLTATLAAAQDAVRAAITVALRIPSGARVIGWEGDRFAALREIATSYFGEGTTLDLHADASSATATVRFTVPRSLVESIATVEAGTPIPERT